MHRIKFIIYIIFISIISYQFSLGKDKINFSSYFKEYKVNGSFVLYDLNSHKYIRYNSERCRQGFIPASTFKILVALIALERGILKDENSIIKWDRENRQVPAWNQDLTLREAIRVSAVWYSKVIVDIVGPKLMAEYLNRCNYGNKDTTGGTDVAWLTGGLRISQEQQIEFLKKLYSGELPFSKRSMDKVKDIILEKGPGYKIRSKTGWGEMNKKSIGWYIGWVEKGNNVFFFATNIEKKPPIDDNFPVARVQITKNILKALNIIE
ncbi:MAG: class D beta-lactamase [FCB group bacterium]